jgi:hypothetical protein
MRTGTTTGSPFSINLKFDNAVVKTLTPSDGARNDWILVTGTVTVAERGAAGSHTISLGVTTTGKNGNYFAVDDLSVKVVSGPNGQKVCSK